MKKEYDILPQLHYKSAYSPMYECYINITHVHNNKGLWIYTGSNSVMGLHDILFTDQELINFSYGKEDLN